MNNYFASQDLLSQEKLNLKHKISTKPFGKRNPKNKL